MNHQDGKMGPWLECRDPSPFLMTSLKVNSKAASDPQCTLGNFSSSHLEGFPAGKSVPTLYDGTADGPVSHTLHFTQDI